jgi:RNA polymerase sigma-70 factor (ECF subfamily)
MDAVTAWRTNSDRAGDMPEEASDEALVRAARDGDRGAFSLLIARHRELVFAYVFARLRDREEAEDIAQETFVRAYRSLGGLRRPGTWQSWLLQIARNLAHDSLRRGRVRRSAPLDETWPAHNPSPESDLLSAECRRELAAAVEGLPELYRVPVLMRFGSGCSRREIAVALGVPESTVIGRLAGAMERLRRELGAVEPATKEKLR